MLKESDVMAVSSIMRTLFLLLAVFPVAVLAVTPVNKNATQATVNLYSYIAALPDKSTKRVISGQEAGTANPTYNIYSAAQGYPLYVTNLKNATGILVGLAGFDYSSDPTPSYKFPQTTDSGVLEIVNTTIISHWSQGGIVTVMFGANNPWTGGAGNDTNTNGHRITDAITPGTPAYTNWIAQLDAVATALKQLQDAGVVVLWRPLHEMNGNWFWWGAASNPQDYKDVWQHMFNYFTNTKKLNNLIWVYSASSGVTSAQNSVNTYYPGANFVDIVGIDGYKDTIDTAIIASYNSLLQNGKPFALTEYGPASPPSGTQSTTGKFDFATLITGIKNYLPKTCYFMAWADCPTCNPKVLWSMVSNLNSKVLLSDPWVVNAGDLAIDLQNSAGTSPTSTASNVVTPNVTASSDCLFNWAEVAYPQFFSPTKAASQISPPYYYRYYAGTRNYLATSSADYHIWVYAPSLSSSLIDVGLLTGFLATAGCSP